MKTMTVALLEMDRNGKHSLQSACLNKIVILLRTDRKLMPTINSLATCMSSIIPLRIKIL